MLLKELNSAIMFEPMAQRKKAFRVLMNIVAKLDLDDRYQEKVIFFFLSETCVCSLMGSPIVCIVEWNTDCNKDI